MAALARVLCLVAAAVAGAETSPRPTTFNSSNASWNGSNARLDIPQGAPPSGSGFSNAVFDRRFLPPPYGTGAPLNMTMPPGKYVTFYELKVTDGEVTIPVEGSGVSVTVRSQVLLSLGMTKAILLITVWTLDDLPRPSVNLKFLALERDANWTQSSDRLSPYPGRSTEVELLSNSSNDSSQCGIFLPEDGWKTEDELQAQESSTTTVPPSYTRPAWYFTSRPFQESSTTTVPSSYTRPGWYFTSRPVQETTTTAAGAGGRRMQEEEQMVCASFRAVQEIQRGIAKTLECANLNLLQEEGLKALVEGDWYNSPAAIIYFLLLAMFAVMFVVACWLDNTRTAWSDEYFLIPMQYLEEEQEVELENTNNSGGDSTDFAAKASKASSTAVTTAASWLKQSSAARDAVDDVISRWFLYFSEVRDFIEGLWEEFHWRTEAGGPTPGGCITRLANVLLGSFVASSARRQAGASLGICKDVVAFITTDKGLGQILARAPGEQEDDRRLQAWRDLHTAVLGRIDSHWQRSASWASMPSVATRIFFVANPFVAVYLNNQLWPSSLRVLVFVSELLGSWLVATVFFLSTGEMRGKRNRGNCDAKAVHSSPRACFCHHHSQPCQQDDREREGGALETEAQRDGGVWQLASSRAT